MNKYEDEFRRILSEEVGDYARRALEQLAVAIQKKGLVLSRELLDSLQSEVAQASDQHVASMGLRFEEYGRIRDMKGIDRKKAPPIEAMEAYVKRVGVGSFQYVPGYKHGQFPLSSATALNRIAWGLARAKLRDNDQVRPKAWFAKTFYASITNFIDLVTDRYARATGQHLAATVRI